MTSASVRMGWAAGWAGQRSRPIRLMLRPIIEISKWITSAEFIRGFDQMVVPGTGILDDFGVHPWQMPYDLFRWSTVARVMRRPFVLVGVGAGPIENRFSRWFFRQTARNASWVSYRDEGSRRLMSTLEAPEPQGGVQPDVVFSLDTPAHIARRPQQRLRVGLGLMSYFGWENDPELGRSVFDRYIASMTDIADRLLEDFDVRLLVGEGSDALAVDTVLDGLRNRGRAVEELVTVEPIRTFSDLLDQIAQTDAVVATRFHNVVASLMMRRPTVSIGYAAKNDELMESFGQGSFCHRVDDIDAETVVSNLRAAIERSDEIALRLVRCVELSRQLVRDQFERALVPAHSRNMRRTRRAA